MTASFSKIDRIAAGFILMLVAFLFFWGSKYHVMEVETPDTPERDFYVCKIQDVCNGKLPRDAYRPLLYPLVAAVPAKCLDDAFAGGRVTSTFSAAAFLLLAYAIGKRCFGEKVGLFALMATGFNHFFLEGGLLVATDMMFSAWIMFVLWSCLAFLRRPGWVCLALMAVATAGAYWTRYTAVFVVPVVGLTILWAKRHSPGHCLGMLLAYGAMAGGLLIPHFMLTFHMFGSPFYNENWANVVIKLHPDQYTTSDFDAIMRDYSGLMPLIRESPRWFLRVGLDSLKDFINGGYAMLLAGGLAAYILSAFSFLGILRRLVFMRDERALLLVAACAAYVALISFTFYPMTRLFIFLLPICYGFAMDFLLACAHVAPPVKWKRFTVTFASLVLTILMVKLAAGGRGHMNKFRLAHPLAERNAALWLNQHCGPQARVAGTSPYLQRFVDYRYLRLPFPYGDLGRNADLYLHMIRTFIDKENVDYLILGRLSLYGPPELIHTNRVPEFLEVVNANQDAVVYKVRRSEGGTP